MSPSLHLQQTPNTGDFWLCPHNIPKGSQTIPCYQLDLSCLNRNCDLSVKQLLYGLNFLLVVPDPGVCVSRGL